MLILTGVNCGLARAQNYVDLLKVNYALSSEITYDSSEATTSLYELEIDAIAPIVLNESNAFLTGIIYERYNSCFIQNHPSQSLQGLTIKLGLNHTYSDRLSTIYMLLPKLSSDFEEIGRNDFQLGAVVLFKLAKNEHFNYKFGAYVNSELFGPFVVPMFGVYYLSPDKKFESKLLLPLSGDLNYKLTKHIKFGLNFKGQIRTYFIRDQNHKNKDYYISRSTNEFTPYINVELENGLNMQLGLARSLARNFRTYRLQDKVSFALPLVYFGDERAQLNSDLSDSWIYKISVFYRLKI